MSQKEDLSQLTHHTTVLYLTNIKLHPFLFLGLPDGNVLCIYWDGQTTCSLQITL